MTMPEEKLYRVECDDIQVYVLSSQGFGGAIEKALYSSLLNFDLTNAEITITLIAEGQELIK